MDSIGTRLGYEVSQMMTAKIKDLKNEEAEL